MPNYSYLRAAGSISPTKLRRLLAEAVRDWFGGAMVVRRGRRVRGWGMQWVAEAPGTAIHDLKRANELLMAPDDNFGFVVELLDEDGSVAFPHSPDWKQNWAQGCVSEILSERTKIGLHFDASDQTYPPGMRHNRDGRSVQFAFRYFNVPRDLATVLGKTQKWVKKRWPQLARPTSLPR